MKHYVELSKKIYQTEQPKELKRAVVFVLRSLSKNKQMKNLLNFFAEDNLRQDIATAHPCVFEQPTRYFFYRQSTFPERIALVKEHFLFLNDHFTEEAMGLIYLQQGLKIWEDKQHPETLSLVIRFDGGQKKEGLITFAFNLGENSIYQLICWLGSDKTGEPALWIGALQGIRGGLKTIRDLTKHFFGYRPKNFILYTVRTIARQLNITKIYAVSNNGFYANNHLRLDRKLKTSLDDFWEETGGKITADPRFFELPLVEPRKNFDEVVPHKRNLYRKRFALLDTVEETIEDNLSNYLKTNKQ